jgi:hypothetical protein
MKISVLDQAALDDIQADVENFDPGHAFTFSSIDLTITGIEQILLTTEFGFTDVSLRKRGDQRRCSLAHRDDCTLSRVRNRHRVVEEDHDPVAGELVERPLKLADQGSQSAVILAQEIQDLLGLGCHAGRLVKLTGDGALVEFPSAVDALSAAIAFQQAVAGANRDQPEDTRIVFRIGLHLGDLIVDGDDLYGDGVNVAARLEAEAPPGGIVVSRAIREAVEGRLKAKLHALGELVLKNIERPMHAFRIEWDAADWKAMEADGLMPASPAEPTTSALALPDKPSIAVLPFQNMSGDPEQEYFTDGITEDIITELSRFHSVLAQKLTRPLNWFANEDQG